MERAKRCDHLKPTSENGCRGLSFSRAMTGSTTTRVKQAFSICNINRMRWQRVRRQTERTCDKHQGNSDQGRQADGDRQPFQVAGTPIRFSLLSLRGIRHDSLYRL